MVPDAFKSSLLYDATPIVISQLQKFITKFRYHVCNVVFLIYCSNCVEKNIDEKFYEIPVTGDNLIYLVENVDEKTLIDMTPS